MASPDSDMDLDSLLSMQSELEYLLQSDSHHFLSQEPPAEPSEEAQPPQPPQPQLRVVSTQLSSPDTAQKRSFATVFRAPPLLQVVSPALRSGRPVMTRP